MAPTKRGGQVTLVVRYRLESWGNRKDLKKRHALEDLLDDALRKAKVGECDGGEIGSKEMEVFCPVADYAAARRVVAKALAGTRFADFDSIYKIAPKPVRRGIKAGFKTGDCLAVRTGDGRFGAAYIAAAEDEGPDSCNVVVELDYLSKTKPDLARFGKLRVLALTHHEWSGKLDVRVCPPRDAAVDRLAEVVGNRRLKLAGLRLGKSGGIWVNWEAKRDPVVEEILKEMGQRLGPKDPSGKYLPMGAWNLGDQVLRQEKWDKTKAKAKRT